MALAEGRTGHDFETYELVKILTAVLVAVLLLQRDTTTNVIFIKESIYLGELVCSFRGLVH